MRKKKFTHAALRHSTNVSGSNSDSQTSRFGIYRPFYRHLFSFWSSFVVSSSVSTVSGAFLTSVTFNVALQLKITDGLSCLWEQVMVIFDRLNRAYKQPV